MKILTRTKKEPYAVSMAPKEMIACLKENSVFIYGAVNNKMRFDIDCSADNVEWDGKNFILSAAPGTEDKTFYEEAE